MDFDLSDEQKAIQALCRDFARNEVAPRAEEMDRNEEFPYDLVRKMAELGLLGLPFPEQYGGAGGDTVSYALAVMEIARVDASTAITLAAGQTASFRLGVTHGAASPAGCVTAAGLQVIPPDDTATLKTTIPDGGAFECGTATVSPLEPGTSAYR